MTCDQSGRLLLGIKIDSDSTVFACGQAHLCHEISRNPSKLAPLGVFVRQEYFAEKKREEEKWKAGRSDVSQMILREICLYLTLSLPDLVESGDSIVPTKLGISERNVHNICSRTLLCFLKIRSTPPIEGWWRSAAASARRVPMTAVITANYPGRISRLLGGFHVFFLFLEHAQIAGFKLNQPFMVAKQLKLPTQLPITDDSMTTEAFHQVWTEGSRE